MNRNANLKFLKQTDGIISIMMMKVESTGLVGAPSFSSVGWLVWSTNSLMLSFSPMQSWWLFNEELLCFSNQLLSTSERLGKHRRRRDGAAQLSQAEVIHTATGRTVSHSLHMGQCRSISSPQFMTVCTPAQQFLLCFKAFLQAQAGSFHRNTGALNFSRNHLSEVHMRTH